jgi:hypothetical protein
MSDVWGERCIRSSPERPEALGFMAAMKEDLGEPALLPFAFCSRAYESLTSLPCSFSTHQPTP